MLSCDQIHVVTCVVMGHLIEGAVMLYSLCICLPVCFVSVQTCNSKRKL